MRPTINKSFFIDWLNHIAIAEPDAPADKQSYRLTMFKDVPGRTANMLCNFWLNALDEPLFECWVGGTALFLRFKLSIDDNDFGSTEMAKVHWLFEQLAAAINNCTSTGYKIAFDWFWWEPEDRPYITLNNGNTGKPAYIIGDNPEGLTLSFLML